VVDEVVVEEREVARPLQELVRVLEPDLLDEVDRLRARARGARVSETPARTRARAASSLAILTSISSSVSGRVPDTSCAFSM